MTGKKKQDGSSPAGDRLRQLAEASRKLGEAKEPAQVAIAARTLLAAIGDQAVLARDIERVASSAEEQVRRNLLSLEADLRSACADRGWSLDGTWPSFFIEKAVEVVIDEPARLARVAGQRASSEVIPIVDAAAPIVRQLLPRSFSPRDFLDSVAKALDVVAAPGGSASIGQLYRQLVINSQTPRFWRDATAEQFVPLSLEQFRARFSRMLEANLTPPDGRALRISPPLNASDGIFLWQPGEHRFAFVGRLQLVEDVRP